MSPRARTARTGGLADVITALWSSFSEKAADRWAGLLFSPAMAFWLGGVIAWVWAHGGFTGPNSGWRTLERNWSDTLGKTSVVAQVMCAALALSIAVASARLGEWLTFPVLRLLEGYWPQWATSMRVRIIAARGRVIDRRADRWRSLARRRTELTPHEYAEYIALSARRAAVPIVARERMPTRLGDLLRAVESRPRQRYGLDAVTCWTRLWLVLPEDARTQLAAARAQMDECVRLWLWSLLFCVWVIFTWWALAVALIGLTIGYRMAFAAASCYGELVQSCFDVHRSSLYSALGWDRPNDAVGELEAGRRLTAFLQRGPLPDPSARGGPGGPP